MYELLWNKKNINDIIDDSAYKLMIRKIPLSSAEIEFVSGRNSGINKKTH